MPAFPQHWTHFSTPTIPTENIIYLLQSISLKPILTKYVKDAVLRLNQPTTTGKMGLTTPSVQLDPKPFD